MISTEYELRDQRRQLLLSNSNGEHPARKRMKSIEHNTPKQQIDLMGVQLVDAVVEFD